MKNTWRAILVCGVVIVSLACGADQDQPGGPEPTAQAEAIQEPKTAVPDRPAATAQATQDTQSGGAPSPPTPASQEAQSPTASAAAPTAATAAPSPVTSASTPKQPSNTPATAQAPGPATGLPAATATALPEPTAAPAPDPSPTAETAPPQASPKLNVGTNVGDLAPEYALQLLSGDVVSSTELVSERQPVFLFFTAVW